MQLGKKVLRNVGFFFYDRRLTDHFYLNSKMTS